MKRLSLSVALFLLAVLIVDNANAQRFSGQKKYWSVGGSVNAMNYLGDVTPALNPASIDFQYTKPNIGVEGLKRMTPRMSVRGQFFWGRLKGFDQNNPRPGHDNRNQRFVNDIKELSGTVIMDFYENRGTFLKRPDYTPYAFFGLAAFMHNPRVGPNKVAFNSFDPEPTKILQGALVYGLGFRYKLAKQWDLALEIGWRNTTTDKMDGVYWYYRKPSEFGGIDGAPYDDQPEAYKLHNARKDKNMDYYVDGENRGEKRANQRRDAYLVTGLHLTYILQGKVVCPKFK